MTESDNTEGSCDLVLVGAHAPWLGGHGAPILLPGSLTVGVGILPGNSPAQVGFRRRRTAVAGLFGMVQLPVSIRWKARCHRIRMARVPDQVVRWSRPAEWLLLAWCLACDPAPYGRDHFSSAGCRPSGSGRSASCSRAPSSARSRSVRLMGLRMGRGSCPRTPRRDRTLAWPCPDAPTPRRMTRTVWHSRRKLERVSTHGTWIQLHERTGKAKSCLLVMFRTNR